MTRAALFLAAAALFLAASAAGCGAHATPPRAPTSPPSDPDPAPPDPDPAPSDTGAAAPPGRSERGRASYYSDRLAGRRTASGERYDPRALTAAHKKLPFGAVVDVIRRDGRRVRVRINDRGPFTRGRVIDLSRRAAEAIGLIREGVTDVRLILVSLPAKARR